MSNFLSSVKGLQIDWRDPECSIDIFQEDAFKNECENERDFSEFHDGGRAYFTKTVKNNMAILEYGDEYPDEVEPGRLKIIFTNNDRNKVKRIIWEDINGKEVPHRGITSWD